MFRLFKIAKSGYLISRQISKAEKEQGGYKKRGAKINRLLSDLGPTFIKFGQMLSLRGDLIPSDLADELRLLLDHGPTIDISEVLDCFKSEFNKYPDEVFDYFEQKPFAVASLSQVHLASYQGKRLAVKVQKPGVKKIIDKDLKLIKALIKLVSAFSFSSSIKRVVPILTTSVEEFFKWIDHELDYRLEALNISRIKNNFVEIKYFLAPEIIHAFSSKRVLTMEFIDGVSLNAIIDNVPNLAEIETLKYRNVSMGKKVFIEHMLQIVFKQVFEDGYFHADPHPGNILITTKNKIAFIDFGVVGIMQPHLKEVLVEVLKALINRDIPALGQALVKLDEIDGHLALAEIERKIRGVLDNWQTGTVIEMSMAEVFYRLLLLAQEAQVDVPLPVFILGKTILEYDGLLRKCDPQMDIFEAFRTFIDKSFLGTFQQYIPASIKELLDKKDTLPADIAKLLGDLYRDGVELVTHLTSGTK